MKSKKTAAVGFFLVVAVACVAMIVVFQAQQKESQEGPGRNFAVVAAGDPPEAAAFKAATVVPSAAQALWQEREFIAFAHFGMNTFTDREWGKGTEDPKLFNPTEFDARQWARALKEAGMRMLIVTAKHHDGFCLWPSRLTAHSVKSSPWRDGKGDVVAEVARACREEGLAFGVYLSPWDRHEPSYGDSPRYNEFFRGQLRELLTGYGPVAEVWFDGACGEGPNGKRQEYDWPSYFAVVRELQPGAVIFGQGPDVRWVGTESGYGRETEWSVIPVEVPDPAAVAASPAPHPLDAVFKPRDLTGEDLGSRARIGRPGLLIWYPAETDVSIRPGWFYHASDDAKVKTPEKLVDIYFSSVGRNGVLLLNVPPDKRGLIHDSDIRALRGMRGILDETFKTNFALRAGVSASGGSGANAAAMAVDGDRRTFWRPDDGGAESWIEIDFGASRTFDCAMLQEPVEHGQRIETIVLEQPAGEGWTTIALGTTVGFKRLLRFAPVTASRVRVRVLQSRSVPALSEIGFYKAAPGAVPEDAR